MPTPAGVRGVRRSCCCRSRFTARALCALSSRAAPNSCGRGIIRSIARACLTAPRSPATGARTPRGSAATRRRSSRDGRSSRGCEGGLAWPLAARYFTTVPASLPLRLLLMSRTIVRPGAIRAFRSASTIRGRASVLSRVAPTGAAEADAASGPNERHAVTAPAIALTQMEPATRP
jgi:hypothetical protein